MGPGGCTGIPEERFAAPGAPRAAYRLLSASGRGAPGIPEGPPGFPRTPGSTSPLPQAGLSISMWAWASSRSCPPPAGADPLVARGGRTLRSPSPLGPDPPVALPQGFPWLLCGVISAALPEVLLRSLPVFVAHRRYLWKRRYHNQHSFPLPRGRHHPLPGAGLGLFMDESCPAGAIVAL